MLSATRRKQLLVALASAVSILAVAIAIYHIREAVLFARLSETEKRIVGAWSWTYLEGVGRMIFTADHRVKEGFPPDDSNKPAVHDRDFTYLLSGTWHVEGDILVTDITNQPLIDHWRSTLDKPAFDRKVHRQRIVSLSDDKIVFEGNHSPLERVHR